jgi:23S rRNA U2552 (ribose-2'-O)-methylase RlmE/FtsJ
MKERFRYARAYSPTSTRKGSAEVYVVGKGYKGLVMQDYS